MDKSAAEAVKKLAGEMVLLGRGHAPGVVVAAFGLAIGVLAKNVEKKDRRGDLIDRIAALAKEAAQTS